MVHLADGIVSMPVCVAAAVGAGGVTIAGLRGLADRQVPQLAVMTAVFFVVGAVHVRIGPGSVHLLFTGLLAAVLGWRAIVPVAIGVVMHAIILQHGGLTTIGVNTLILGVPALLIGAGAERWRAGGSAHAAWLIGASATVMTYVLSTALLVGITSLFDRRLNIAVGTWAAMHLPVMLLEVVVTGSALAYLSRTHQGAWRPCCVEDLS